MPALHANICFVATDTGHVRIGFGEQLTPDTPPEFAAVIMTIDSARQLSEIILTSIQKWEQIQTIQNAELTTEN